MSFGLTQQLYNFWHKSGFEPLYLRQSASETTGEYTLIMVKPLEHPEVQGTAWLQPFVDDFKVRVEKREGREGEGCGERKREGCGEEGATREREKSEGGRGSVLLLLGLHGGAYCSITCATPPVL